MKKTCLSFFTIVFLGLMFIPASAMASGTWSAQTSGVSGYLDGVSFVDANNGWAVGDGLINSVILHTSNGGDHNGSAQ